ncbi:ABC transporter ATP-binding protein [Clostridium boliviensis]|uniref:ABC transporter ATP-binding protein n=1 Tax=Clostridium boliviensis TaxID=318465 RepID=A0ABU4GTE8_9CLOT|nr:ABC transporter ATP-binding protein [Clostridium boliviensis]MDW2800854.1 ABC transporter ATP-binding protein [Clostridium boliviensis]
MIEFKNVCFTYNGGKELDGIKDINLTIHKGETLLITGGSGCGKTTVTRLINGLIPHFFEGDLTGEILIHGKNISKEPIYQTSNYVGSVFQNPRSQFFNIDTTSELAFAPENQGISISEISERIEKTVSDFNLQPLMDRSIFQLSGGEKQKIACASVSVAESEIIVLDEPSSNLDIAAIGDLRNMIAYWKKEGRTIIIAEHRLYFLRELADRLILMRDGRIVEELPAEKIRNLSVTESQKRGIRPLSIEKLSYLNDYVPHSTSLIKLSDLSYTYKDKIHGVGIHDIKIKKGAVVAVIGHNGAGKSTFAKCLCGLEKKCKGILEVEGKKCAVKKGLNYSYMVMQDVNHQLFTESVMEEVLLSMRDKVNVTDEEKEKQSEEILKSLDLLSLKEKHPMALSGGQKQRVAIASAIAAEKSIILFDEPTSGLDYRHMHKVSDCIKDLSKTGKTIFVITHDLELILHCCTDVIHLEQGRVKDTYSLNKDSTEKLKFFFLNTSG